MKPRVLVLNQYYWPGVEATAHLLTELCEALASDFDITVVTGLLHGQDVRPGRTTRNNVTIVRVPSTAFDRRKLPLRALNYASFLGGALLAARHERRPDVVLSMTDPPMIADIGVVVARRAAAPLVIISQDVFPEVAVELKRLENPLLIGLLRMLVEFYLRRADRVVAIGETMASRLEAKGARRDRIAVIPNWTDTDKLTPQPRENRWSIEQGFAGKFIVMHSGNIGHAQDLDSLIRAATFLRDIEDLRIVLIGAGARREELGALAERLEVDAVHFLPYQPRPSLSESLSSADVHVVGLAKGLSGFVVPSRLYSILAVGRPVIAAVEETSETAHVIRAAGAGVVVPPGRPELLAATIRAAHHLELPLDEMGGQARVYAQQMATKAMSIDRYRALLWDVVAGPKKARKGRR